MVVCLASNLLIYLRFIILLNIHLFGFRSPSGQSFLDQFLDQSPIDKSKLFLYSRNPHLSSVNSFYVDLQLPQLFYPIDSSCSVWISFAPIWLFSDFLRKLSLSFPDRLDGLKGVIACSSSSAITKRFSSNEFDRLLVKRLISSEHSLFDSCKSLGVPCRILRPTLIYGSAGNLVDNNLSLLLHQLRRFPFLPLPVGSGLRQPIHASQLAAVVLRLVRELELSSWDQFSSKCIAVGGDTTLSYSDMIRALQQAQEPSDPARRCHLLHIPKSLFFLLASPLLLRSPKAFEAVLRMGADLSGFTPAHQLLDSDPQPFPVLPLA